MKKIIIINHYGRTPESRGTTRHFDMAKKIYNELGCEVEFWICGNDRQQNTLDDSLKYKLFSSINYEGVKVVKIRSLPEFRKNGIMRQLNITLFSILTGLRILLSKKIDLCVLSVPPLTIFNTMLLKIRGTKIIIDVEDLWPLFLQDLGFKNKIAISIMEKTALFMYNSANAIDTVSSGMEKFVKSRLKDKDKTVWVSPLGVNVSEYFEAPVIERSNYRWRDKFVIMYAGAHGVANNLLSVIKAAEILKDYKDIAFVFFGDGGEKNNLINYVKEKNIENVYFEDPVSHNLVPSILKTSDVCITHLRKVESFKLVRPNKIFEYMAVAKPVICGIHGEATEIVNEAQAGICVEPENSQRIADAVLQFYNNPDQAKSMGNNGYEYISKHGDREKILLEFVGEVKKQIQF